MTRETDIGARATQASSAYHVLRKDIINATVAPGSRLQIRNLCERIGVGLTPMREALSRLSSEGFVTQQDHRGFTVAPLSETDLATLTATRCWLNEVGLRQSIQQGGAEWEEQLVLSFHRLKRTQRNVEHSPGRNPNWEAAHRDFHMKLTAGAHSPWLDRFCEQLFDAAERYRSVARITGEARLPNEGEHEAIMNAALNRDANKAAELLNAHLRATEMLVRQFLAQTSGAE